MSVHWSLGSASVSIRALRHNSTNAVDARAMTGLQCCRSGLLDLKNARGLCLTVPLLRKGPVGKILPLSIATNVPPPGRPKYTDRAEPASLCQTLVGCATGSSARACATEGVHRCAVHAARLSACVVSHIQAHKPTKATVLHLQKML